MSGRRLVIGPTSPELTPEQEREGLEAFAWFAARIAEDRGMLPMDLTFEQATR